MKSCQIKRKNKIIILFIFIILLFGLFNNVKEVKAVDISLLGGKATCKVEGVQDQIDAQRKFEEEFGFSVDAIKVEDIEAIKQLKKIECTDNRGNIERTMDQITTWTIDKAWKELMKSGAIAWRQGLRFFLNQLAYDMATYLATGDKGQLPMFETEGWGGYLKNVADNTAGAFIEDLGKKMPTLKFNLCQPNSSVMIKINLGLDRTHRPKAPACTFSQLVNNWDAALNDKDFLPKFQDMFNPWSNDLGIALTLQTGMESEITKAVNEAAYDRLEGEGFKPVRDVITRAIKTPANLVKKAAGVPIEKSTASEEVYTGEILADSIDIFINTLIGKLVDQWLRKGLVTDFAGNSKRWNSLADPDAQNPAEGVTGAAGRFKTFIEPNFKVRAAYDILAELTICPDPNKAGPTNCVIDERFREAIEKRLTVGQAMEQGYLSANGVFGFTANGLEPKYNEGYPYRSMLILRKFRILPLGWEVAAQKIKDQQNDIGGTKNLSDLVDCTVNHTAAWCDGLVDPNWVLKAPQNYCQKEGPGPEILSEQVSGEGAGSSLSVLRNDNYCADEQSLIKEDSDGSNPKWGYCTEEKRIWDFNGKSCAPRDNTCQTFGTAGGETVSYLQNTLYFGVCNAGNVGCAKYATNGNYSDGSVNWGIANNNPIYLNKNAASCEAADEGCHEFIRITPDKNETFKSIEQAGLDKAYQRFSASGLIYEKLLPDYLKDACYDEQGRLKIGAPAKCSDFARQCKQEEVGCELYTSQTDGAKIPAKVMPIDYCPAACVGYDTFIQKATTFSSSRDDYFIPKTAKTCSAENSGCEQFTNLDEVKKGGEGVEYYTYLRQCLAKAANADSCGEFYSWEGSDESGYQLKVESLKISDDKVAAGEPVGGPAVTENDSTLCTKEIYNYPPGNPAHNSDCREFYNRAGEPFYHLYKRTISCSDNCHPYRKTAEDNGSCQGGGSWDDAKKACIYMAIPGQGATCPAAMNGCREYTGNTGNDVRNIFTDDFEASLNADPWRDADGLTTGVERTNVSLTLQNNIGHSMLVKEVNRGPAVAKRTVGNAVKEGKAYVLSFLIRATADTTLKISLATSTTNGLKDDFTPIPITGTDWQIKKTNLANLFNKPTADEFLEIKANQNFYIDNIVLTEIVDTYYLIRDSWKDTCNYLDADISKPVVGDAYYAGCDQYQDRASKTHNLRQFSELCSEAAVGCELMIDTKNSNSPAEETFTNDGTTKTVPADEFTYVVYDQDKLCNKEAKGCSLLGKSYNYENETLYGDIHLKNNPDNYKTILCGADAVGCQAFTYDDGAKGGEKFFKDPGDVVCEWRQRPNVTAGPSWLKKKVKRCQPDGLAGGSDNGSVCLSDKDCSAGVKCQTETADEDCPLDTDSNGLAKTLGQGGAVQVSQPAGNGWAGVCAAANSGCGEYIDPVSEFNANMIFNGSFADLDNKPETVDGWVSAADPKKPAVKSNPPYTQNATLEPNTVYRLARAAGAGSLTLTGCPKALYEINQNNSLADPSTFVAVDPAGYDNSKIFYYRGNNQANCTILIGAAGGSVELKPAIIDYQLAQNLDKKSCNGVPDFNKGCILFNERSQDGANLLELKWDADREKVSGSINDQDKDSNAILKVTPDRTCDKWLACKSKIKDEKGNDLCYSVGLCNAIDDKNNCISFINSLKTNQALGSLAGNLDAAQISNLSGYAKAGLMGGSLGGDYYPFGAMEQKGEVANLANGGFEFYGSNGYPIGWVYGAGGAAKPWDANVFSVINNPIAAQVEGIGYAREGRAFLKLGSSYDATSQELDVLPGNDYIITAYSNTKNLKSGTSAIDILNKNGAVIKSAVIEQALGNDWEFKVGKFSSGANSTVKVKLYASAGGAAGSEGNFYFDDIKIRPALESKCLESDGDCKTLPYNAWHTAQSCRLYPQTDSLACDYYEDSGKRQKGWPGYCLEYDRPPGDPNTCLLWYPVDRIKGDGFEEGASYIGKFPVYYCLEASSGTQELNGQCSKMIQGTEKEIILGEPYIVWNTDQDKITINEGGGADRSTYGLSLRNYFDQKWTGMVEKKGTGAITGKPGWVREWDLSTDFDQIKMFDAVKITCIYGDDACPQGRQPGDNGCDQCECSKFTSESGIMSAARCETIAQTVSAVGQNKYWSSRVYEKSDYTINSCNVHIPNAATTCSYGSDQTPFGSIVPPANSISALYNPYEWDTKSAPGIQPLYYEPNNGQPRMGQELSADSVKQIFAKTYGTWTWNKQVCQGGIFKTAITTTDCVSNNSCQATCNIYACFDKTANNITGQCQGGINDGKTCSVGADGFCNKNNINDTNSCNYDSGSCAPTGTCQTRGRTKRCVGSAKSCTVDADCIVYRCVDGSKAGNSCVPTTSACQPDSRGVKRCVGSTKVCAVATDCDACQPDGFGVKKCVSGTKTGKYCSDNNDCDDCKGCRAGAITYTYGTCESSWCDPDPNCGVGGSCNPATLRCVGGSRNGQECSNVDTSCGSLNKGACLVDKVAPGNVCVGGNKGLSSCQADSSGVKTCAGGSKAGQACNVDNDCNTTCNVIGSNDCKGCVDYAYGQCNGTKICEGGANNGLACSGASSCPGGSCRETCSGGARNGQTCLNDRQCNCATSDLSTCDNASCPNYDTGSCEPKKVCDAGCNKDQTCNGNAALCASTQCYECRASLCNDGKTSCSNDATCSGTCGSVGYTSADQPAWGPPGANGELGPLYGLCPVDPVKNVPVRADKAYCAIRPEVSNIKVQNKDGGEVPLNTSQVVNLTFNSKVDSQQLPLVMYAVDWGDNEKTVITGMEMRDRPEASGQEHSLYHLYSYWDLMTKFNSKVPGINCSAGQCTVIPKIQIKDNWGWCNGASSIASCNVWQPFNGTIVVKEK